MNQADPEQNQPARSARATALESGFAAQAAAPQPIQATWQPSDAAVSRALGLYPDADIAEHTALFVSRCRAKGYPVRAGGEDDMWLSWLIDDRRTAGSPSGRAAARGGAPSVPAGTHRRFQDARFERFAAWSLAADRGSAVPRQA
jgi:hypothetical protein